MLHHNEIVVVKLIHLESCDSNRTKCLYISFNPLPSVFCTLYAMNVQYMQYKYIHIIVRFRHNRHSTIPCLCRTPGRATCIHVIIQIFV